MTRSAAPHLSPPSSHLLPDVVWLKQKIAGEVQSLFNDVDAGERPVVRSAKGLFGPRSVVWRVHGDVTGMMVGGVAALLLQMLHPGVMAGVWDHSNFRADMLGRLRRTARFIALTTYGDAAEAESAIARVRAIHEHVRGTLPDGTPYSATDPALLAWVHLTETTSFLDAWIRYAEPLMSAADQDRYFAEMARLAEAMGAAPIPRSRADARRQMQETRPQLRSDERSRTVSRLILRQRAPTLAMEPWQAMTFQAGVDLLPDWARRLHGLADPLPLRPLLRAGTYGIAEAIRWAFR